MSASSTDRLGGLPEGPPARTLAFGGMVLLVVIELTVFAAMIVSYFYLRVGQPVWPPVDAGLPALGMATVGQGLLLFSAAPMFLAGREHRRGGRGHLAWALPAGAALVLGYATLKVLEYRGLGYRWTSHAYGSITWTLTGYQLLHVTALLGLAAVLWVLDRRGLLSPQRSTGVEALGLYWYFTAASSLLAYVTTYLIPYVL